MKKRLEKVAEALFVTLMVLFLICTIYLWFQIDHSPAEWVVFALITVIGTIGLSSGMLGLWIRHKEKKEAKSE